jgi:hypothetical protein
VREWLEENLGMFFSGGPVLKKKFASTQFRHQKPNNLMTDINDVTSDNRLVLFSYNLLSLYLKCSACASKYSGTRYSVSAFTIKNK